jgi:hypothetical protein
LKDPTCLLKPFALLEFPVRHWCRRNADRGFRFWDYENKWRFPGSQSEFIRTQAPNPTLLFLAESCSFRLIVEERSGRTRGLRIAALKLIVSQAASRKPQSTIRNPQFTYPCGG